MEDIILKRFFTGYALFLLLGFSSLVFMGCDTMTDINRIYAFHNRSSHTVTMYGLTGQHTIAPEASTMLQFNKHATISSIVYEPSERVSIEQSGSSFTFTDR